MNIVICDDYQKMSEKAAEIVANKVSGQKCVLGLATGSTPEGMYSSLVEMSKAGKCDFSSVTTFNLDEYVGIPRTHEQSYHTFMRENLFDHIDIDINNTNVPCGDVEDLQQECDRYNALLDTLKQDIQLLGIGANGHIGFNEPGTSFDSVTYITDLQQKTISDNARFFESINDVPTQAITMGVKNIMNAKKVLLLASGLNKANAIKALVLDEISESCPASVLRNHDDVIVIVDKEAASLLEK